MVGSFYVQFEVQAGERDLFEINYSTCVFLMGSSEVMGLKQVAKSQEDHYNEQNACGHPTNQSIYITFSHLADDLQ